MSEQILLVDPNTFEWGLFRADRVGATVIVDGSMMYRIDEHIYAVLLYRLQRAREKLSEEDLHLILFYFAGIEQWTKNNRSAEWINKAEKMAREQIEKRNKSAA